MSLERDIFVFTSLASFLGLPIDSDDEKSACIIPSFFFVQGSNTGKLDLLDLGEFRKEHCSWSEDTFDQPVDLGQVV